MVTKHKIHGGFDHDISVWKDDWSNGCRYLLMRDERDGTGEWWDKTKQCWIQCDAFQVAILASQLERERNDS